MLVNHRSPGFGLTLVAETLNGCFLSAEMSSTPQGQGDPILPEDLGRNCAKLLLEEVHRVSAVKTHSCTAHMQLIVVFEIFKEKICYPSCLCLRSDLIGSLTYIFDCKM